jgi:hypothetical protein
VRKDIMSFYLVIFEKPKIVLAMVSTVWRPWCQRRRTDSANLLPNTLQNSPRTKSSSPTSEVSPSKKRCSSHSGHCIYAIEDKDVPS